MAGIYELKKSASGQFHFVLKADNGEVILSSEEYKLRASAEKGVESVRKNSKADARFERKTAKDGSPFFIVTATNGKTIGVSETYSTIDAMEKGIASVKANGPTAKLKDLTAAEPEAKPKAKAKPKAAKAAATTTKGESLPAAEVKSKVAGPVAKAKPKSKSTTADPAPLPKTKIDPKPVPKTEVVAKGGAASKPKAKASAKPKGGSPR